ncbi:MAG TPA: ATP-binding cassette domain-containing protein [Usitatibacteraceae bacterium]
MPIFHVKNLSLAFGDAKLLDGIDFAIEANERIALVGRNGTGKSSLLRIIAGEIKPDDGDVARSAELKLAYVPQEPEFDPTLTVFDAVAAGLGGAAADLIAYHHALVEAEAGDADALDRLGDLQHRLEASGGWSVTQRVTSVLDRLGLDADKSIAGLSGGTLKRVALARALVSEPELLLLDEPTNHLDIASIDWLEKTLAAFSGAILVISHDRRFLESFATRIIELDRGQLTSYPGSFAEYERRKEEALNAEALANARFDKLLKEEEVWIRKGVEARRTRSAGRVARLHALRNERAARRERAGNVKFSVGDVERSGKIVTELIGVSKSFGDKPVILDFSTIVQRGDRIGLIGPNGAGKSTLMKIILGELASDRGEVKRGTQLSIAYFDQFREALDDESALAEVISPGSDFVDIGGTRKHVISYLGDFLFPPQRARAKVKSLSGGERNRLLLARLFAKPANFLVLDEPTNDLDIETLDLLEELLQGYAGTVLVASHDRAFLDNVATQVLVFEGQGVVREFAGGYSDWQMQRASMAAVAATTNAAPRAADKGAPGNASTEVRNRRTVKLSSNEQRELDELPARIDALDKRLASLQQAMADPANYQGAAAADKLKVLQDDVAKAEAEQAKAMARWETLEEKRLQSEGA